MMLCGIVQCYGYGYMYILENCKISNKIFGIKVPMVEYKIVTQYTKTSTVILSTFNFSHLHCTI